MSNILLKWRFIVSRYENTEDMSNVIGEIKWRVDGTCQDTGKWAKSEGVIDLQKPKKSDFIPFKKITKDQMKQWVFDRYAEDNFNKKERDDPDRNRDANFFINKAEEAVKHKILTKSQPINKIPK
jgi:hypothetical protein